MFVAICNNLAAVIWNKFLSQFVITYRWLIFEFSLNCAEYDEAFSFCKNCGVSMVANKFWQVARNVYT